MAKSRADKEFWDSVAADKAKADIASLKEIANDPTLTDEEKDKRIIMESLKRAAMGGNSQAAKVFLDASNDGGVARVELSADDYMYIRAEAAKRLLEWSASHKAV